MGRYSKQIDFEPPQTEVEFEEPFKNSGRIKGGWYSLSNRLIYYNGIEEKEKFVISISFENNLYEVWIYDNIGRWRSISFFAYYDEAYNLSHRIAETFTTPKNNFLNDVVKWNEWCMQCKKRYKERQQNKENK